MSAPTVSVTMDDIRGEVGHFLGYGRGAALSETTWTTAQTNDIVVLVRSAMNRVCEPLLPDGSTYSWSWLKPFASLTIESGTSRARLPEDFDGFEGPLFLQGTSATRWFPIDVTNIAHLEHMHATSSSTTGPPRIAAEERDKESSPHGSQRSYLRVWPTTDAAYTLRVNYRFSPDTLSGGKPYPPGGPLLGELFMAAAVAVAELKLDDMKGPRWEYFQERLLAAIANDRRRKGQKLGYNGDPGMGRMDGYAMRGLNHHYGWGNPLSVNGVVYD